MTIDALEGSCAVVYGHESPSPSPISRREIVEFRTSQTPSTQVPKFLGTTPSRVATLVTEGDRVQTAVKVACNWLLVNALFM
jgi:hypothetical protein